MAGGYGQGRVDGLSPNIDGGYSGWSDLEVRQLTLFQLALNGTKKIGLPHACGSGDEK